MQSKHHKLGLLFGATTLVFWGILPIILKLLVNRLDPYTLTWCRFLAGGVLLLPVIHFRYGLTSPFRTRGIPLALATLCILGLSGNYLTYLMGLQRVSPGSAQIVMQFSPVFVLIGGVVLFREPFGQLQWIGFAVLLVGMLLFFNQRHGELLSMAQHHAHGVFLIFAAAVLWAVFMLAQKPLLRSLPSASVLFLVYGFGALLFLPLARPWLLFSLTGGTIWLLACSIGLTLASYLSFAESLKRLEASRIGALVALVPLVTLTFLELIPTVWQDAVGVEPLNRPAFIGALLVVAGTMCSTLGDTQKRGTDQEQPGPFVHTS